MPLAINCGIWDMGAVLLNIFMHLKIQLMGDILWAGHHIQIAAAIKHKIIGEVQITG